MGRDIDLHMHQLDPHYSCFRGEDTTGQWRATVIPAAKALLQDQLMDFTFYSVQEGKFYLKSWFLGAWLSIVVFLSWNCVSQ